MTFVITRESVYFVICVALLILQIYQYYRLNQTEKHVEILTNQLMILFLSIRPKEDGKKEIQEEKEG
jgi:hypothetical protein